MKKGIIALIIVAVIAVIVVAAINIYPKLMPMIDDAMAKEVTYTEGDITITLPKGFTRSTSLQNNQIDFGNSDCMISILNNSDDFMRENNYELDDAYDFAKVFASQHIDADSREIHTDLEYPYIEYEEKINNTYYTHFLTFFEGSNGWYTICFYCDSNKYYSQRADFVNWANTIVVK